MAKTTQMRLIELMVLKEDIEKVIEFLGRKGNFQFQSGLSEKTSEKKIPNDEKVIFSKLQEVRAYLNIKDLEDTILNSPLPVSADFTAAETLIKSAETLKEKQTTKIQEAKKLSDAYNEAKAFSNLKASYSDIEHLTFLSLRIGKIDPAKYDELKGSVAGKAVVVPLGEDNSRILAASSKKGRFELNTILKKYGFVEMEVPRDFKGIPDNVLQSLKEENSTAAKNVEELTTERNNFAETHKDILLDLLGKFSVGIQIRETESRLESTQLVYRLTGWIPAMESRSMMTELDKLTEGRVAIRQYLPNEVPSVIAGKEKVPVLLRHGKVIGSFERMIFSYGSPVYGTVDPTPFVALFFTLLFGIMFGDAGQGLVFFLIGLLMAVKVIKIKGWNKFAPIFMAIGSSSIIMGLLTGEFFADETVLRPFEQWVTGLFGTPRNQILSLMPQSNPESIRRMFLFFAFSLLVGFVINSVGLIINIINEFTLKRPGKALFGTMGLSGASFFWYVIVMIIRMVVFSHTIAVYDWIVIGVTLALTAVGEPLGRFVDGERPVANGEGTGEIIIGSFVAALETVMTYMSNTISFLRVGAFALAHAVLDYIIFTMVSLVGGIGGIVISILGNVIVVVLEGMIVAIQAIRLQYYEFFSKFFSENGKEFKPYRFYYGEIE